MTNNDKIKVAAYSSIDAVKKDIGKRMLLIKDRKAEFRVLVAVTNIGNLIFEDFHEVTCSSFYDTTMNGTQIYPVDAIAEFLKDKE